MTRSIIRFTATAGAVVLLLAGCASPYDAKAADELQALVLTVSEAVGAGDFVTADARLDELVSATDIALANGQISAGRRDGILAAASMVQADVDAAVAEAAAAAAEAEKQRLAAEEAAKQAEDEDHKRNDEDKGND